MEAAHKPAEAAAEPATALPRPRHRLERIAAALGLLLALAVPVSQLLRTGFSADLQRTTETEQYLAASRDRHIHPDAHGLVPAVWWIGGHPESRILYAHHPPLAFAVFALVDAEGLSPEAGLWRMRALAVLFQFLGGLGLALLARRAGGPVSGLWALVFWITTAGQVRYGDLVESASLGLAILPWVVLSALAFGERPTWVRAAVLFCIHTSAGLTSWYAYLATPALACWMLFASAGPAPVRCRRTVFLAAPWLLALATNLVLVAHGLDQPGAFAQTWATLLDVLFGGDIYARERTIEVGASAIRSHTETLGTGAITALCGLACLRRSHLQRIAPALCALSSAALLLWILFPTRAATHTWFALWSHGPLALLLGTVVGDPARSLALRRLCCGLALATGAWGLSSGAQASAKDARAAPTALAQAIEARHGAGDLVIMALDPTPPGLRLHLTAGYLPWHPETYWHHVRAAIARTQPPPTAYIWCTQEALADPRGLGGITFDPATLEVIAVDGVTYFRARADLSRL